MSRKKLTKTIWFGSEVDITGQPILPPIADNSNDLNGLHEGELYLHNADEMPSIWVRTKSGLIKSVTGSGNTPSFWELKTTDNGFNYLYTKLPIVTQYGVTMYKGESINLPSIYDGLPIDHDTIYWENGILKAKGGSSVDEGAVKEIIESYGYTTEDWVKDYVSENATGGIESITKQMVIDALGFTPYSAANPNGYITAASIPSALKNPYSLTFGSKSYDGSTALSITASDLGAALSSDLSKYLPLSGGVLTANNSNTALILKGDANGSWVAFRGNDDTFYGSIGVKNDKIPYFYGGTAAYKLWHEGNDGSGSGLDADLLDGKHISEISKYIFTNGTAYALAADSDLDTVGCGYYTSNDNIVYPHAPVTNFGLLTVNLNGAYKGQIVFPYGSNYEHIRFRSQVYENGVIWKGWRKLAYIDDNVASATKLQTARTIWGQSFDGTGNVSGDLNGVGKIIRTEPTAVDMDFAGNFIFKNLNSTSANYWHIDTSDGTPIFVVHNNGKVGIGTTNPRNALYIKTSTNTPLFIEQSYSSSWTSALNAFNSSLVAGQHYNINIGHSASKWNQAWFGYYHAGNGSANNMLCLGLNQADDILNILASGNVGIGTTSPAYKLDVNGTVRASNYRFKRGTDGADTMSLYSPSNTATFAIENRAGAGSILFSLNVGGSGNKEVGKFNGSDGTFEVKGNVLIGGGVTMYSQRILKNIVDERGLSLTELSAIKPTRYTWKDKRDDRIHFGGIADDIQQVLPEVVYKTEEGILTMDYGNAGFAIASSLIKPVVDHEERIKALERENELLKQELNRLRA